MNTLCHIDEIEENQSKQFEIGELVIFAIKKNGKIYVYENSCPHLGVELNWERDKFLDMDGALIQCSTHGALFLIETGECVSGPCLKQFLKPVAFTLDDGVIRI